MKKIVLDTSALITLIEEEPGAEEVEKIIQETLDGEHQVFISIIAKIELFYISVQEQNLSIAKQRMQLINDLPLNTVDVKDDLIETIGKLKAKHSISFADSCIAGLAKNLNAKLVHKDPEFEYLENQIKLTPLPYK